MAITSEPLLLYYQELVGNYKKQVRDLQTEVKNYRRREEKLKTQSKNPTLVPICKKTYSESSAKLKRQISQRLKESFDILLENCTPEDKKAVLIKAFPDAFVENKLTTEQTWYFEQKFKFNNGNMDKLRSFLNKFNLNPFASRRQINVYKEKLARENPDMLTIQIEDSDNEIRDGEEMEESSYMPNASAVTRNNQRRVNSSNTGANLQDEIYTSNASYGQQLIQQQEQYLRRANSQTYRQNPQQSFGPSAFLPATTSYTSFYSGHY
ncbi:hypothetical protein M3Y97_00553400 [Aphelenchoides bicaudatus]|nr:hypothetical protein M3Y97_00553400 [Aphelenchoides bicaudatus]